MCAYMCTGVNMPTYCCDEYHEVICLKFAETNLLIPQESSQRNNSQSYCQQSERLGLPQRDLATTYYQVDSDAMQVFMASEYM